MSDPNKMRDWCKLWGQWAKLWQSGPPTEEEQRLIDSLPIETLQTVVRWRKDPKN